MKESKQPQFEAGAVMRQAIENFESAVKTGLQVQEDATRRFVDFVSGSNSSNQWQARGLEMFQQSTKAAQQNLEDALGMFNRNLQTGLQLLDKSVETTRGNGDAAVRVREFWDQALGAARTNAETLLQMHARWVECWTGMTSAVAAPAAAGDH
jgi:hypothetical protein